MITLSYPTFLDYDGSLHDLVELVTLFETSPRSSKSEFGCKSYCSFSFVVSVQAGLSGVNCRPDYPAPAGRIFQISGPRNSAKSLSSSRCARLCGGGGLLKNPPRTFEISAPGFSGDSCRPDYPPLTGRIIRPKFSAMAIFPAPTVIFWEGV